MLEKVGPVLALDPGGKTGSAFWCPPRTPITDITQLRRHFTYRQIVEDQHHYGLWKHLCICLGICDSLPWQRPWNVPLTIVCESFEFNKEDQQRDKIVYISAEYVGVVKVFHAEMSRGTYQLRGEEPRENRVKLVMQPRSLKDGFWKDPEQIKKLGLWAPGMPHSMDALRHLLYYACFTLNDSSLYGFLK